MIYYFSDIRLLILLLFVIYLFIPEELLFVTLLVKVHALFPILLISVILFNGVSVIFAVCTVLIFLLVFFFPTDNIYYCAHMHHSFVITTSISEV